MINVRRTVGWSLSLVVVVIAACGDNNSDTTTAPRSAGLPAVRALPDSTCSPISYGGQGEPDLLIAMSSLLQGQYAATHGLPAVKAVKMALRERDWKGGPFAVGLQVCDEADAKSGVASPPKCERTARAVAANRSVVGVVGPQFSTCGAAMIAPLNEAPGGPVPIVSGGNTYLGLTRSGPGTAPGEPDRYYPTGERNYARVAPTDDVQGAAAAVYAQKHGAARAYALHNRDPYGQGLASAFGTAAERIGLELAGTGSWNRDAPDFRALAARIAGARPDAVFLAGYHSDNGGRLIRDLRDALGERPLIMASDGFADAAPLVEGAGSRAEGVALTIAVFPARALPPDGRAFVERYEKRFSHRPCCYAVHFADATAVLLDTIARSDGTRGSVLEALLPSPERDRLVGRFGLDEHGDTTLTAIGVYRIRDRKMRFEARVIPPEGLLARDAD
jgi:branched-chain amino acid transport system substrate-binding protein